MPNRLHGDRHHAHSFAHDTVRLDQHFLAPQAADLIVAAAQPTATDVVLEIGAGTGILTAAILDTHPARLLAVEVDQRCESRLARLARTHVELTMIMSRIQEVDRTALDGTTMIIANPPFAALETMTRLIRSLPNLRVATLCVSRRWAETVAAPIDSASYGATSVAVQSRFSPRLIGEIDGRQFTPAIGQPATLLQLTRRRLGDPPLDVLAEALLHHGGMRVKSFLRSNRLRRTLDRTRRHGLLAAPTLKQMQQRRLTELSGRQIAELAAAITR